MRSLDLDDGAAKVGVIIPVYNMEAYLSDAVEGVLGQTFQNWEAWLVDDGSADNSPKIAMAFAERYPDKIHYLEHPNHQNRGVSASRNLALDQCACELIAFLDADDTWDPEKLQLQVAVFEKHPDVGLVYGQAIPIKADGNEWSLATDGDATVKIVFDAKNRPRIGYGVPFEPVDLVKELVMHCCLVNSTVMVRKSVLDAAGRFDESMKYAEDWLLYTCVAHRCLSYFIPQPLARYRIHESHFSASIRGNELAQFRGSADFLKKLPQRLGPVGAELKQRLKASRSNLHGRALTRAEQAWSAGDKNGALQFARFAWSNFPEMLLSRRTAAFFWRLLTRAGT